MEFVLAIKILKFGAKWCSACTRAEKFLARHNDPLALSIEEIDVDAQEDLAIKYGIRSLPTFLAIKPNGDVIAQLVGFNQKELIEFIKSTNYR